MSSEEAEALCALCPLDGRYRDRVSVLRSYFSESALMKYRVRVEVEYLIQLTAKLGVKDHAAKALGLRAAYENFTGADALRIKAIEKVTNHDVKAIEYFLKEKLGESDEDLKELIHFGLTSQDVNHLAQPLALAECTFEVMIPKLEALIGSLRSRAWEWRDAAMLARTHGQAATPTRLGKEIGVFVYRLEKELKKLKELEHSGKFGGATGLMNAHFVAYPDIDWYEFADTFVESLKPLKRQQYTTQIENYDDFAAFCHCFTRINTILLDACRDLWQYVSLGYFRQIIKANEVGSSAMPHKVNPIDFENAEGNVGVANALFLHLASKLPVSRLQRDLSDSTVLRTVGMPLGHTYLAISSVQRGLSKLAVDYDCMRKDLEENWPVVAEAIQTILRREKYPKPYEALKALTRGKTQKLTETDFKEFINTLNVSDEVKLELSNISPHTYIGKFDASPFQPEA